MMRMRIHKIELENYRQYHGKHVIELSVDNIKNLNIILGANGTGKTNLLNAINWCLYGDEPSLKKTRPELQQCVANVRELHVNGRAFVRVGIFIGEENPTYYFERAVSIEGTPTNFEIIRRSWRAARRYDKNWQTFSDNSWDDLTIFNILVSEILPIEIRDFFFFDGERLDDFFRKGMEHEVKKAITKVCHIELLDRCISHLEDKISEIRRKFKGESSHLEEINNRIEALQKTEKELEESIERLDKLITDAEKNKEDIEEQLRQYEEANIVSLQEERDGLESDIEHLDKRIERKKKDLTDYFISNAILIYSIDALEYTFTQMEKRIKREEHPPIPPDIKDTFLKELLERKRCICGAELNEGSKERESIEKLLNEIEPISVISNDVQEGYFELSTMLRRCENFAKILEDFNSELEELNDERAKKAKRLKEISNMLLKVPAEEIQNLEILRRSYEDEIRRYIERRGQEQLKLKTVRERIRIEESDLRKEISKSKKQRLLKLKWSLCEDAINVLKTIKENVINNIRAIVEEKTKEYFFALHWKKQDFSDVKIKDNYEISVLGQLGEERLGTLSAGERQILALSFMAALSSVSGFKAPVIIDTPLGRISGEPKKKIAQSLPYYLRDTQITLLITDQEYTPTVRDSMISRIGKEFELVYNENDMKTEVIVRGDAK